MSEDKCIACGRIIPEGRMVCPLCENAQTKVGMILQSRNATEDEVKKTYNFIKKRRKKNV